MKFTTLRLTCALCLVLASTLGLGGCAFVPKAYPRLDEANALRVEAQSDANVARFAGAELSKADEALVRARVARDTLEDPAVVDHLTYVAKQRLAIAREAAGLRAARETIRQMAKFR